MTRKTVVVLLLLITPALIATTYFACRRPARVQMERYAPATALAYLEVASLVDLVNGLTGTQAWRELGPALGMSSQLQQVGRVADLLGRTGLGPDEAVVAGRAQLAAILTGLEAESGAADDGSPYIKFKPRFALLVETHSGAETASRLVRDRAQIIAQRLYGQSTVEERSRHFETELISFRGESAERQLVVAASGGLVLIANHDSAVKSCLDAIEGRTPNLSENDVLKQYRSTVDNNAAAFAFITSFGSERMAELGPALFASRFTTDPEQIGAVASLFGHMTKQTIMGLLYGAELTAEGVTERYATILSPSIASELAEFARPGPDSDPQPPPLLPRDATDFTILNVENVGDLPDRLLKRLGPRVDVVAALALREFISNFRKQLGLVPSDSLGSALGSELTLIRFGDEQPIGMMLRVKDRTPVLAPLERYLKKDGSSVISEQYEESTITVSSHEDGRAAAFVSDYLILATRAQIQSLIDAMGSDAAQDERVRALVRERPRTASIFSYRRGAGDAGEMMLAVSELARATDGSRDLLETDAVRRALNRLPPSVSFTEFREYGVYTETRSSVGNFGLIGSAVRD